MDGAVRVKQTLLLRTKKKAPKGKEEEYQKEEKPTEGDSDCTPTDKRALYRKTYTHAGTCFLFIWVQTMNV
jgi:hypothetical protein